MANKYFTNCDRCGGSGKLYNSKAQEDEECDKCDGRGYTLTKDGGELVELLVRIRII